MIFLTLIFIKFYKISTGYCAKLLIKIFSNFLIKFTYIYQVINNHVNNLLYLSTDTSSWKIFSIKLSTTYQ